MDDIFAKKPKQQTLNFEEVIRTIPKEHSKVKLLNMSDMIEHRWRFYKIQDKLYTEISKYEPNKKRKYLYKDKEWTEDNENHIDTQFNKYIVDEYYYYTDN